MKDPIIFIKSATYFIWKYKQKTKIEFTYGKMLGYYILKNEKHHF